MAAIRKRVPPPTPTPPSTHFGARYQQKTAFRATGKGYFNKLPHFPADEKIANAVLRNDATTPSHPLYKMYLFVDAVETGWTLSGQATQAQTSRSWYPRNMAQDELIIQGTVANQHDYDRLVEFVQHHHLSQFNPAARTITGLDGNGNYPAVSFRLFTPQASSLHQMPRMQYNLVITGIAAGHERFKNFPTYEMTCKVTYDHLQADEGVKQAISYWTTVKDVYGDVLPTVMSKGSDMPNKHKEHSKKKKNKGGSAADKHHHPGDT